MEMISQRHRSRAGCVPVAWVVACSGALLVLIRGLERLYRPGHGVGTGVAAECDLLSSEISPASRTIGHVASVVALILVQVAPPALAQVPPLQGLPPRVVSASAASPPLQSSSQLALDQISECVDSGALTLEIDLRAGRVAVADAWDVEIVGSPTAVLTAMVAGGRVSRLDVAITGGTLLLKGRHLRPNIRVQSFHFEEGEGITGARYRGRGIWRPIVWVFRFLATSALSKLELHTDLPSVLHGEVLVAKGTAPSPSSPPGPSFVDLVHEVRIRDSGFAAYGGRPLSLGTMVEFRTARRPREGTPVRLRIESGRFRRAWKGRPAELDVVGRVDGEIEDGTVAFVGNGCTFSHGELMDGAFRVTTRSDGALEATLSAASLAVDLTGGEFHLPGGTRVEVEAPSRFVVHDLVVRPDGRYSGIVDADLFGEAGGIERGGIAVSLSDVKLRTSGTTIVDGRATGDVEFASGYRMDYPLVLQYPVAEVGERLVQLVFRGSLTAGLHLQDAGSGEEGAVTGEYRFTVPWPPVEQAAFEALRAAWMQDITPAMPDVDFVVEPRRFGPCGGSCFLVGLDVTVEKTEAEGHLFRQICRTQGTADLVVDKESRSFVLGNVQIEPRCEGAVGWVVGFLEPLLATTYGNLTLFQMPEDLPFTIESVTSGSDWIALAGQLAWTSKAPDAPAGSGQGGVPVRPFKGSELPGQGEGPLHGKGGGRVSTFHSVGRFGPG